LISADLTVSDKNILGVFLPMPHGKELTPRSCECKWGPAICCEDHDLACKRDVLGSGMQITVHGGSTQQNASHQCGAERRRAASILYVQDCAMVSSYAALYVNHLAWTRCLITSVVMYLRTRPVVVYDPRVATSRGYAYKSDC
jgi:hypothetical protein